jgi:glycosyltransferase involved in cell wall biosynthesis
MSFLTKVLLIGGPDVDARIELMHRLKDTFEIGALGSHPALQDKFLAEGFLYNSYHLNRQVNPFSDLVTVRQLISILKRLKPDIVHAFDTKPGVWGCMAARLAGVPVIILTLTGMGSLYDRESFKSRITWPVYKQLQTMACRLSDRTIFQNHDDAHYFNTNGMVGKEKTEIILGSGVSTDLLDPNQVPEQKRTRLRDELGIQNGEIVVTMISRVIRSKGVLEFMTASQVVGAAFPNTRFLLVGPEDNNSLDRLSPDELYQLKQTVTCTGAREDISVILAVSDIFVLPSAYREGLPRVLLEASSMGLPLITTASPGCKEAVEEGTNGFLIPIGDAKALSESIVKLIKQPNLRQKFGKASRSRTIKNFDISVVADQTRFLYQKLLAQKGLLHTSLT